MKAIHNEVRIEKIGTETVFNTSKIQNESNSQQPHCSSFVANYCFQYFKDTK